MKVKQLEWVEACFDKATIWIASIPAKWNIRLFTVSAPKKLLEEEREWTVSDADGVLLTTYNVLDEARAACQLHFEQWVRSLLCVDTPNGWPTEFAKQAAKVLDHKGSVQQCPQWVRFDANEPATWPRKEDYDQWNGIVVYVHGEPRPYLRGPAATLAADAAFLHREGVKYWSRTCLLPLPADQPIVQL
jgi:hypothetical protein